VSLFQQKESSILILPGYKIIAFSVVINVFPGLAKIKPQSYIVQKSLEFDQKKNYFKGILIWFYTNLNLVFYFFLYVFNAAYCKSSIKFNAVFFLKWQ
jgi:hypothetical protein